MAQSHAGWLLPDFSLLLLSLVQVGLIQVSVHFVESLCFSDSFACVFFQ